MAGKLTKNSKEVLLSTHRRKLKMAKKTIVEAKAKAIETKKSLAEYVEWYTDIKYVRPIYQRPSNTSAAAEIFAHLLYLVTTYDPLYTPSLDTIHIRWADKKILEIIDGQHRSDCFAAILNNSVAVPATTSNRFEKEICTKYAGRYFSTFKPELQDAIRNLKVAVTEHQCSEENARAFFHALNSTTNLSTADKIRNNYCDNNLYKAIEDAVKEHAKKKTTNLSSIGYRNMIYRALVACDTTRFASAKLLNPSILDDNANISESKANKLVAGVVKTLAQSYSILDNKNRMVHLGMGTYMYLKPLTIAERNKTVSAVKKNSDEFNYLVAMGTLDNPMGYNDTPSDKKRSDTARDIVASAIKAVI